MKTAPSRCAIMMCPHSSTHEVQTDSMACKKAPHQVEWQSLQQPEKICNHITYHVQIVLSLTRKN